jgi:hypothetical protein
MGEPAPAAFGWQDQPSAVKLNRRACLAEALFMVAAKASSRRAKTRA